MNETKPSCPTCGAPVAQAGFNCDLCRRRAVHANIIRDLLLLVGLVAVFFIVNGLVVAFDAYVECITFSESLSKKMSTSADVLGWLSGGFGSFAGNVALKGVGIAIATAFAALVFYFFFCSEDPKK